ncbi:MAG: helix-turn-helix domain-containing protein [Phycisphaeraceae bacterium]
MAKKQTDMVMTIGDVATYLKLSKSTLYKLAQEGKVPGQKVGRHWRFHREVIDGWLAGRSLDAEKNRESTGEGGSK